MILKKKNEKTYFSGYIDFYNLFSKFFEKINIRKYDDVDDVYDRPIEFLSDPRTEDIDFDFDSESESESDGFDSDDVDGLFSSDDSDTD